MWCRGILRIYAPRLAPYFLNRKTRILCPTMKRESPCESRPLSFTSDKRPKLASNDSALENGDLAADLGVVPLGDTSAPSTNVNSQDLPANSAPESSSRRGKSGGRGRGRGKSRGRDQRARTDRNAEKSAKGSRPRRGTRDEGEETTGQEQEKTPRLPKKKVAMQIGFCGTGKPGF